MSGTSRQGVQAYGSAMTLEEAATLSSAAVSVTPVSAALNAHFKRSLGATAAAERARSETRSRSHSGPRARAPRKAEKLTARGAGHTTAEAVLRSLDGMAATLEGIKRSAEVGLRADAGVAAKSVGQVTAGDLSVMPGAGGPAAAAEADDANSEIGLEDLDLSKKSAKERIAELRARPELLRRFVQESREAKARQRADARQAQYEARLAHQRLYQALLGPGHALRPVVCDIPASNKRFIRAGFFDRDAVALRRAARASEANRHIQDVIDRCDDREIGLAEARRGRLRAQAASAAGPVLPQTFVLQRRRLLTILFFSARMLALRDASVEFSDIRRSNDTITAAALLIQQEFRCHAHAVRYRRVRESATLLQAQARVHLNRTRLHTRLAALGQIAQFMHTLYNQGTFAAALLRHDDCAARIAGALRQYSLRKRARLEGIKVVLARCDRDVCTDLLRAQRVRLAEAAARAQEKKRRDRKNPAPAVSLDVTPEEVDASVCSREALNVVARCLFAHIGATNSLEIDRVHALNRRKYEGRPVYVFNYVPSVETCMNLLYEVHAAGDAAGTAGMAGAAAGDALEAVFQASNEFLLSNPQLVEKYIPEGTPVAGAGGGEAGSEPRAMRV